ncbi:MAG: hypothetical protein Q4E92_06655, partial [Jeotgalicoccus sp.]|nr:hypothetical protein [Jeotgalicoccus sp.]
MSETTLSDKWVCQTLSPGKHAENSVECYGVILVTAQYKKHLNPLDKGIQMLMSLHNFKFTNALAPNILPLNNFRFHYQPLLKQQR